MSRQDPEMTAQDVIAFVRLLNANGIEVIIDGGWAVDAQVGRVTRRHADLDIAVDHRDTGRIRTLLETRGYSEVPRDDSWECNFVLGDEQGHQIDVHSYSFDADGKLVHGVPYPFESLAGHGTIGSEAVRCITPEWLVQFHTGYPLDENDYRDVKALCQCFGIAIPAEYRAFIEKKEDGAAARDDF